MALTEQVGTRTYHLSSDGRVERTLEYVGDRGDEGLVPAVHPDDANCTLREIHAESFKESGGSACDDKFRFTGTYRTSVTKPTVYEYGINAVQVGPIAVDKDGNDLPDGVQVFTPRASYTVVKRVTTAAWNAALANVYALTGKTNSAACSPWDGNPQNSMLFLGATATRESDDAYWVVRYTFLYDVNLHKHGEWNPDTAAWVWYRVYDEGDFSTLP